MKCWRYCNVQHRVYLNPFRIRVEYQNIFAINGPAKSKCILTHCGVVFSWGCVSVAACIFWCTRSEWQLSTFSSVSLFIQGHQTYDLAIAFIQVIPRWLPCKSYNTLSLNGNGMITRLPHNKHELSTESSFFAKVEWLKLILDFTGPSALYVLYM